MQMLSSTNFGRFVLVASLFNPNAFASDFYPDHLKIRHEIISIQPNCNIAKQQIEWLHSIRPTYSERSDARNKLFFIGGFSRNFWQNRDVAEGTIDWAIDYKIKEILEQCRS